MKLRRLSYFAGIIGILALLTGCPPPAPNNGGANATAPPLLGAEGDLPNAPPKFVDSTLKAGIKFQHQSSKSPRKYLIETMGSGGAFIDYDNDGWQDIILLNDTLIPGGKVIGRPHLQLYHNNRDGTFTDVTSGSGLDGDMYAMGIAVGDYDNDGKEDIYITCALGTSHLFHNEGGGKFKDVTKQAGVENKGMWGTSCAWVDYDRDGKLDLFVCNYVKYTSLSDDKPCYAGTEHQQVYCIPAAYESSHCTLYHNEGNGKFKDVTKSSGIAGAKGKSLGLSVWDIDGDGYPDIFVANDTVPGFLFHNQKDGTFKEIGVEASIAFDEEGIPHSGMGIDTADALNNGKTSLLITNFFGQKTSYYTQTDSTLFREDRQTSGIDSETAKVLGFGILFFDYDNDGWQDFAQVDGHVQDDVEKRESGTPYKEPTLLFRNMRNGTFSEVGLKSGSPFDKKIVGRGLAVGDFDNDGKSDLLITANNGSAMLWHNETDTINHWLTLKLIGVKSNRDGIGAVIVVKTKSGDQKQMLRSGSSYLSQSDLRPHFGLGATVRADIEIHWPSGIVDKISGVSADKFWTVTEGSNRAAPYARK